MTRRRLVFLAFGTAVAIFAAACSSAVATPTSAPTGSGSSQETVSADVAALQRQLDDLRGDLEREQQRGDGLESELDEITQTLDLRTAMLEGLLTEAQTTDALLSQKEAVDRVIATVRETTDVLDNDRSLLIELRKDTPPARTEAEDHWRNIKSLAIRSDPSLSRPADRVLDAADAYFAWQEKDHATQQEATDDYFSSGAGAFFDEIEDFKKDVLFMLILRLDTIVQQAGTN